MKCKTGFKKSGNKCIRKNPTGKSKNNPINWNALWTIVTIFGIVIMAGVFFWGGSQGWFQSLTVIDDTNLISFLNTPETISTTCSLSISPDSIYARDRTTGTIVDGKNKLCHVYVLQSGVWSKVYEGYTDSNGVFTNTRTIHLPGDYIFRAVCDLNDNNRVDTSDCLTNQAELIVIPRPDDETPDDLIPICTDSDGGQDRLVPGHVTLDGISYYDDCAGNWAVKEFWCDGNVVTESIMGCDPGFICTETRSGDYCMSTDTGYNVGDIVGGGTGIGILYGPGAGTTIDLSDVEIGGNCHLGAKIWTSWKYKDESDCTGVQGFEGVEWNFFDSTGFVWQDIDYSPESNYVDLCPLVYDGQTNWRIEMIKLLGFPDCGIEYDWKVEVYVCECD